MPDSLLLSCTRVTTRYGNTVLTNASGFFFENKHRLFLVTSRHVMTDESSAHHPDNIDIVLHTDPANLARWSIFNIPLYASKAALWRQHRDGSDIVDVAVMEIDRAALPDGTLIQCFTPEHLPAQNEAISAGTRLLIAGYPLGFHDTLHQTGVVRHATLASVWNLRFQGHGMFLTDARTHRGSSGAPVVMHVENSAAIPESLPYMLLGIHSSRFDIGSRDQNVDEALGLNCAWYSNVLLAMTQ